MFCAHGAGFVVEWDRVEEYMHLDYVTEHRQSAQADGAEDGLGMITERIVQQGQEDGRSIKNGHARLSGKKQAGGVSDAIGQDEIDEIMNRTYGVKERKKQGWARTISAGSAQEGRTRQAKPIPAGDEYLLVDGYNIIFAWDALSELAQTNLDSARSRLMDILSNFQGCRNMRLILVFDAYKVKGNPGSTIRYHNIDVVYTKEAETADQYIEKVTHEIGRKHRVRVATSDGLEQLIIMGAGAIRVSAAELQEEVMEAGEELRRMFLEKTGKSTGDRNYLLDGANDEVAAYVNRVRKG